MATATCGIWRTSRSPRRAGSRPSAPTYADLGSIEDEVSAAPLRPERLRPLLRRLQAVLVTGALSGAEAGAKDDVIHLIEVVQRALGA